jgi:hypothetical protein
MSPLAWPWKRTGRKQKLKLDTEPQNLREFVYLDELSVYSLLASLEGPIAESYTMSDSRQADTGVDAKSGGTLGLLDAELSAHHQLSRSQGTQVVRKSIVQDKFRALYSKIEGDLGLSIVDNPKDEDIPGGLKADRNEIAEWLSLNPLVVDPESLDRGKLIEVEIELAADKSYHLGTIATALRELVTDQHDLFGSDALEALPTIEAMSNFIGQLHGELVPIRCKSTEFKSLRLEDRTWLIPRRIASRLPKSYGELLQELHIVGVAEESMFWRDRRRVLFSNSTYKALCRMAQPGIGSRWTPNKIADVLEPIIPGFSKVLDNAFDLSLTTMHRHQSAQTSGSDESTAFDRAQELYIREILGDSGGSETSAIDFEALLVKGIVEKQLPSLDYRRKIFAQLDKNIGAQYDIAADPETSAMCRQRSLVKAGFDRDGTLLPVSHQSAEYPSLRPEKKESSFLEVELVAIYW